MNLHTNEITILNTIKQALGRDSKLLPPFIDNLDTAHKFCYEIAELVILDMSNLFQMKILTQKQLGLIVARFDQMITSILNISESIGFQYYNWFTNLLNAYKDLCLANELYEVVKNIDNFVIEISK